MDRLQNEQINQAQYDRFIEMMARLCLKYGSKVKIVSIEMIRELFPDHQCGKKSPKKGA